MIAGRRLSIPPPLDATRGRPLICPACGSPDVRIVGVIDRRVLPIVCLSCAVGTFVEDPVTGAEAALSSPLFS